MPPVTKLAQAEDAGTSARTEVSKGRFLVDNYSLVLVQKDGASETNKYYIIHNGFGKDKCNVFTSGYMLVITRSDGSVTRYELMHR